MTRTYMGESPNKGRLVVGQQYEGEGYAVVRCGGTEVQIGYTLLHSMLLRIDSNSSRFSELCDLQKALYCITAEASLCRTGDDALPFPAPEIVITDADIIGYQPQ